MDAEAAAERKAAKKLKLAAVKASTERRREKAEQISSRSTLKLVWEGNWEALSKVCTDRQGTSIEEEDNVALCTACKLGNYTSALDLLYMGVDPCWQDNLAIQLAIDASAIDLIELLSLQPGVPGRENLKDDTVWADSLLGGM